MMNDDERPEEQTGESEPAADEAAQTPPETEAAASAEEPEQAAPEGEPEQPPAAEEPPAAAEEPPAAAEEPPAAEEAPAAAEETPAAAEETPAAAEETPAAAEETPAAAEATPAEARKKPEIPGADLEVDIVPEGSDPLAQARAAEAALAEGAEPAAEVEPGEEPPEPEPEAVPQAAIDLGADARYTATGKRKTAIARVILKPGSGAYAVNGHTLEEYFPRATAQRNIREPLETVGYEARMDVVASLHGGGVSAQAGALRHGISRALLEADPNLRIELKRRGFLTRDARVKERKKAGLKKARKRPQFSKR
jgi:small subunit ribosomal protein S9